MLSTADSGRAVVVDTGPQPGPIGACLDRLGVDRIPLVILSHLHADHVGGLGAVLADRSVGAVAVGPARVPGWAWEAVHDEAARAGVPVVALAAGQRLAWPGLTIEVLAPRPGAVLPEARADGTEINNSSVVLRADTPAGRTLLTGDIELAAQADLLTARVDLSASVLKVPHHGSRYTAPEFLEAIGARIAVVSVGAGNRYGHPSPTTIGALDRRATLVLRTDTAGDSAIVPTDTGPRAITRGNPRAPPKPRRPLSGIPSRYPWSMPMTTIKVDSAIRDRLAGVARARGLTLGALLSTLVERLEAEQEWADIESAYARMQRDDPAGWQEYLRELAEWDVAGAGLDATAAEEWPEFNR